MAAVDVVIPAHEKDYPTLRRAVRSVLRHVTPVRRVLVVAASPFEHPDDRVHWIAEPSPPQLPTLADVRERWAQANPDTVARASWVYQQLLKLGADRYIDDLSSAYLVVDSDVVFLRPVSFDPDTLGRFPFSHAPESHEPYREVFRRLFGEEPPTTASFIAHHMLFDRMFVNELFAELERRHGRPWYEALLDAVDPAEVSGVSEWEIYGWWVLAHHPNVARQRQLVWRDVPTIPGPLGRAILGLDFDFVVAHRWLRQTRSRRAIGTAAHLAMEVRALRASPFARSGPRV
jgi:hypothetical protein